MKIKDNMTQAKLAQTLVSEGNVGAVAALLAIKDERDRLQDRVRDLQKQNDELARTIQHQLGHTKTREQTKDKLVTELRTKYRSQSDLVESLRRAWREQDDALGKANARAWDLQQRNAELTRTVANLQKRCGRQEELLRDSYDRFDNLRDGLSDLLTDADGREYE